MTRPTTADGTFEALLVTAPNTNMMTITSLVDGMRAANRMSSAELFRYQVASWDGNTVEASNGFMIPADHAVAAAPVVDNIFVLASYEPDPEVGRLFITYLRKAKRHSATFYGIDQGSVLLAAAGLLDGRRATTHWEVLASLPDRFPNVMFVEELFVRDGARITCAGHTACVDLIANVIEDRYGTALASAAMQEMIYGRLRNGRERQRVLDDRLIGVSAPRLAKAVAIMKENIDTPLSVAQLAERSAISRRQLEAGFRKYLHCSPARYYSYLRLSLARQLLLYSELRIVDISSACGFISQANFSRAFHHEYGTSPSTYRRRFHDTLDRPIAPRHDV